MSSNEFTNIVFLNKALPRLIEGLNATAEAVACTLGPKGRTVLIKKANEPPILTKDGVTVSKNIFMKDPLERIGSMLVQEAANRTNEVAGDGTTTATLLTQTMANQAAKFMAADVSSFSMARGVDAASRAVVKALEASSRAVTDIKEVEQVAIISANGDRHVGHTVATAIKAVGNDGVITVEDAKGMDTTVELSKGMRFNGGYLSPYFVNNNEKMIVEYKKPYVFVTNEKINDIHELVPILTEAARVNKPLLIVAEEVDGTALQGLVVNRTKNNLPVVAIKSPGYGETKRDFVSDICIVTGATCVSKVNGIAIKDAKIEHLGILDNVIVTREHTTMVGSDKQPRERMEEHIANLRLQSQDVTIGSQRKSFLQLRIANLINGVAIIKVGGTTELEMVEKKYRIEDALNATRAAIEEGVVAGGGLALLKVSDCLTSVHPPVDEQDPEGFTLGVKIVKVACEAPIERIAKSCQVTLQEIKKKLATVLDVENLGFDANKNEFVDMMEHGIIDPTKVTRSALQNATSVVLSLMSMDAIVCEDKDNVNGN